jgi:predicted DNA-binding transcriptional regulator AlpA
MNAAFNLEHDLITRDEIATILKVTRSYLDSAAVRGKGPPYFRIGRAIRYDRQCVADWLKSQTYTPPTRALS